MNNVVKRFTVEIFNGSSTEVEPEYSCKGVSDQWLDYQHIRLPGFDSVVSVSLEAQWQAAIGDSNTTYIAPVIGYETIVKFGNTMQMKSQHTVKLSISYY